MRIPLLELAAPMLATQHALITRRQAVALSNSEAAVRNLLARGIWESIDRGLYGPTGTPMSWKRSLMAAVLLAPTGSLVSHRAAAALHGVGGLIEPTPEITIPRGTSLRRPWIVVHESVDFHLAGPTVVDGIPTTGLRRLAMDLGAVVSFERFKHTIRELRHGHGVSSEELLHTYLQHKERGRNGGGALRDWLDRYFDVSGVSESGLELLVLDALIDAGIPQPARQLWVQTAGGRFRLDLAYPDLMIAIEVDGSQHDDLDIARDDQRRTELLEGQGWRVLRIRSSNLASDLATVVHVLRAACQRSVVD